MQFLVKVRLDTAKVPELGKKLMSGELDRSAIEVTYCSKDDPAVGTSVWNAADRAELDRKLSGFLPYYEKVIDVSQVISAAEAQAALMARTTGTTG